MGCGNLSEGDSSPKRKVTLDDCGKAANYRESNAATDHNSVIESMPEVRLPEEEKQKTDTRPSSSHIRNLMQIRQAREALSGSPAPHPPEEQPKEEQKQSPAESLRATSENRGSSDIRNNLYDVSISLEVEVEAEEEGKESRRESRRESRGESMGESMEESEEEQNSESVAEEGGIPQLLHSRSNGSNSHSNNSSEEDNESHSNVFGSGSRRFIVSQSESASEESIGMNSESLSEASHSDLAHYEFAHSENLMSEEGSEEFKEEVIPQPDVKEEQKLELFKCKICYTNLIQVMLLPCGHTVCSSCAIPLRNCPFDRKPIHKKKRMFCG